LWVAGWLAVAILPLVVAAQINPPTVAPAAAASSAPRARLGVGVADFDINGAARAVAARHAGAMVTSVAPGGAADRAGLKTGDVILKFGETSIAGMMGVVQAVASTAPGASVPLVIQRGSESQKLLAITVHFSLQDVAQPQSSGPGPVIDASDWDTLRDASLPIGNRALAAELIQISGLEQLQAQMRSMSKQPPIPPNTAVISFAPPGSAPLVAVSAANVKRFQAIMAEHGWPTVSMVGVRGARAAALIVMNSKDPGLQAEALALMEPLMQRDEVPNNEYALVYDMVHTPQRYGTQGACENGQMKPTRPIEDPEHLADRRAALGLVKLPQFCVVAAGTKGSG
jgi:membrane-associated protease RseP (regulator of RpoE activity)